MASPSSQLYAPSMTRPIAAEVLREDREAEAFYRGRISRDPAFASFVQAQERKINDFIQSCMHLIRQMRGLEKKDVIPKALNGSAIMVVITRESPSAEAFSPLVVNKEWSPLADVAREPLSEEELNNVLCEWEHRVHACVLNILGQKSTRGAAYIIDQKPVTVSIMPTDRCIRAGIQYPIGGELFA